MFSTRSALLTQVRTLATKATPKAPAAAATPAAATNSDEHAPLIKLFGIHARYANATYTAASKIGTLDKVESELQAIKNTATTSATFGSWLSNPTIARSEKVKTVEELLDGKMSPVTCNLMSALAGNARLGETTKVVDSFIELMKAKRGEVDAVITSAEPLSKPIADAISAALLTKVGKDKKIMLKMNVDPTIMGGLQVQIGDQFMDLSVGAKIGAISRNLMG